jgi:F0F1-type ATP synthase membrane subunit b/b'
VETLKVDVGLMVWTLLTFAGLLLLLSRFAFRPLKRILDEREDRMRQAL